jgi:hypothetical protein
VGDQPWAILSASVSQIPAEPFGMMVAMAGFAQHYTSFCIPVTGLQLLPAQRQRPANHGKTSQRRNRGCALRESLPAQVDVQPISCPIQGAQQPTSEPGNAKECIKAHNHRRQFPYSEVAKLWQEGKMISEIAHAIGRFKDNKKDPCHSLRNFLRVMHQQGYMDASGQRVKLPYRVRQKAVDKTPVTEPAQRSQSPSKPKKLRPLPQRSRELISRYKREELYEKVWAQPIQKLAKEYRVSDVALAKACKRRRVPVPGRGYWAKKAAGKAVPNRPPLGGDPPFPLVSAVETPQNGGSSDNAGRPLPPDSAIVSAPNPVDGSKTVELCAKFTESIRDLLRGAPKRFKEIYPLIAERQPEDCPAHGNRVSLTSVGWLHEIQRELQEIGVNRDGLWHLKEQIASPVPVQRIEHRGEPAKQAQAEGVDGDKPNEPAAKFTESIRDLLRGAPKRFKEIYPLIAERQPGRLSC